MSSIFRILSAVVLMLVVLGAGASADMSADKAIKKGEKSIKKMINQSYHYRIEYDTVLAVPVHSRIKWKNDFYLLYFLQDNYFKAEMEIDAKTGDATLLAVDKMSQPYYESHTGLFNYRYFDADSIAYYSQRRHSILADSVRLVYFGVIPKLGKRGVIWEIHSPRGVRYQSPGGPMLTYDQIVTEINSSHRRPGNYTADEIRYKEIKAELARLDSLTVEECQQLDLNEKNMAAYREKLESEMKDILLRFPELRLPPKKK